MTRPHNYFLTALIFLLLPITTRAADLLPPEKPIHETIDHYIDAVLKQDKVTPAKLADDATLVRRLTLDLAGRIPTAAETKAYVASKAADKKIKLVDRLLGTPDFAFHQRNELDLLLLARLKTDNKWRDYLLQATRENRSWDNIFRELILGQQGTKPEDDAALEFIRSRIKELDDVTNDTSQIFFGVSINCAKCHDHPLVDDWHQDHYFGFASFFNRTYLTKKQQLAEKSVGDVKFKTTAGEEKTAKIMFLSGTVVPEPENKMSKEDLKKESELVRKQMKEDNAPDPTSPAFSPRARLVEVALNEGDNAFFAKSISNRVWKRLLGRGLVDPLDQMHSGNPASHPELLDWLARDLTTNKYDLKRLIRGIVLSHTYARSSRWEGKPDDTPVYYYFAVANPRPLSPRQYALSLLVATANPASFAADTKPEAWAKRREQLENASNGWAGQFEIPHRDFQISVDEALLLSNNDKVENDLLRNSADRLVGHLKTIKDKNQILEQAFLAVLSRKPTAEETTVFAAYLSKRDDRAEQGIRQVVWALISSPELRFNY